MRISPYPCGYLFVDTSLQISLGGFLFIVSHCGSPFLDLSSRYLLFYISVATSRADLEFSSPAGLLLCSMTVLPGDAIPNGKMCIPPSEVRHGLDQSGDVMTMDWTNLVTL